LASFLPCHENILPFSVALDLLWHPCAGILNPASQSTITHVSTGQDNSQDEVRPPVAMPVLDSGLTGLPHLR